MKKLTIILILFAIVLTACASLGVKHTDEAISKDSAITPSPNQAVMGVEEKPVIVFQRNGGIAGVSEQWNIYATGKITTQKGEELSVDPAQVTSLLAAIQAAGLFDSNASSGKGVISNCKDCFTYQLSVNGENKVNTITVQQGAKDIPDSFWTIINQINNLITVPEKQ